ncbi:MAG TPA: hypothetical protein VES36_10450 [Candidatus Limnocylindrales bacterium]|nr:hypothetical protein [Candidatus Limnocylindrales bacterium]
MIEELLMRGADDWVTAAEVAWVAKSMGGSATDDGKRDIAFKLIRQVLEMGLMKAGDVTEGGFSAWELSPAESFARIEREWRSLGRIPEIGEVAWLANTPSGSRRAEALFSKGGTDGPL